MAHPPAGPDLDRDGWLQPKPPTGVEPVQVCRTDSQDVTDAPSFYALVNDLVAAGRITHAKVTVVLKQQGDWSQKARSLLA